MGRRVIPQEVKQEIIEKIESGKQVKAVAEEYGIKLPTVYSWLRKDANGSNESLTMSRLKRENKALLALIGRLTYEKELREKKGFNL